MTQQGRKVERRDWVKGTIATRCCTVYRSESSKRLSYDDTTVDFCNGAVAKKILGVTIDV
jgi:hypothetical protein